MKKAWIVITVSAVLGCAAKEVPPRYYVATSTIERQSEKSPESDVQKVVPWAGSLLKNGKATVAILPPSWCSEPGGSDTRQNEQDIKACLALTAELEKRAAEQGYRVVDWRRLGTDPHRRAKQEQLDVLFIIDELTIHVPSMDKFNITNIEFSEQISAKKRAPVALDNMTSVTGRCMGAGRARHRRSLDQADMTGATISIKMVSVEDGAVQWFYKHSVNTDSGAQQNAVDLYYLSEGVKETKNDKIVWGTMVTGLGISAAVIGTRMNKYGDSFAQRNIGFGLAWASIVPLTIGLTLSTIGIVAGAKAPTYQSPDKVLCARPPVMENPFVAPSMDSSQGDSETYGPPGQARTSKSPLVIDGIAEHMFNAVHTLALDRTRRPYTPETIEPPPSAVSRTSETEPPPELPEPNSGVVLSSSQTDKPKPSRMIIIDKNTNQPISTGDGGAQ